MRVSEVLWKRAGSREELNLDLMHPGQFPSRSMQKISLYLFFCFVFLLFPGLKYPGCPPPKRNRENSKDGKNEIWRTLQAWCSSRLYGSSETDTFRLDATIMERQPYNGGIGINQIK